MGLLFVAITILFAFNSEKAKEYNFESITLFTYEPFVNYAFKAQKNNEFEISPTRSQITGVSLKHKAMTYAFGYEPEDKNSIEKTNFFDVQVARAFNKVLATAYYQNYQGFYFNDNGVINLNNKQDISSVTFGVNLRYFTDKTYDIGMSILSNKKERVADSSWFHSAYANSTKLKNSSKLFERDGFEEFSGLRQMNVVNLGYEYGYTRTFHLLWMRFTGLLSIGYNIHNIHLEKPRTTNNLNGSLSTSFFLDIALLDINVHSIGIFSKYVNMSFKHEDIEVSQRRASITAYYRYFF